jgi:hypothetical protein
MTDEDTITDGPEAKRVKRLFAMPLNFTIERKLDEYLLSTKTATAREIGFPEFVDWMLLRLAFEFHMCVDNANQQIGESLAEGSTHDLEALFGAVLQSRDRLALENCLVFAFNNLENDRMPERILRALRSGVDSMPIEVIVAYAVKQTILSCGNRGYGGTSQIRTELKRLKHRPDAPLKGAIWNFLVSQQDSELADIALTQVRIVACAQSSYCEEFCRVDLGAAQTEIKHHFGIFKARKPLTSWWPFGKRAQS